MQPRSNSNLLQTQLSELLSYDGDSASNGQVTKALCEPISKHVSSNIVVIEPDVSLEEALSRLSEVGESIALVQGSPSRIDGIVQLAAVKSALSDRTKKSSGKITDLMERNISIEPDVASLREVIVRMTAGACHCVVVVDTLGTPYAVVTPQQVYNAVAPSAH